MDGKEIITLDSDSDQDEDLRRAIELSLQDQLMNDAAGDSSQETNSLEPTDHATFGGIVLNRKEMEESRLNRLGKRRRNTNESSTVGPATKRLTPQQSEREGSSQPRYPQGIVRRTWSKGYPKTPDDITIEEIFQSEDLQLALLSSFQWDEEWLLSKLDVKKTRVLLLAFAASEEQKQVMKDNVPNKNIRFCFPPMCGPGSMHSKLQLLKYPKHLRLVIPTGNLVPYDWGETGVMENMVFLIDLPRLEASGDHGMTTFGENMANFLKASGVDDAMVRSLANYDFSATENIGFVCSIPGGHTGDALRRVGYCGLGATVRGLGLATDTPVEVDLACASLGSINGDLVNAIYNACQGDDGLQEYNARVGLKLKNKETRPPERLRDRFRIYFPTDQTVSESKGGRQSAGTICVQEKWWRSPRFPRELVRDCINNRVGLLMHSKIIFVRSPVGARLTGQKPYTGWAYIGSANLSESAWGRVVKDRGTGNAKMSCRNWECGVIVPAHGDTGNNGDFSMFSGVVPVPMEVPGRPYEKTDEPWFFLGGH